TCFSAALDKSWQEARSHVRRTDIPASGHGDEKKLSGARTTARAGIGGQRHVVFCTSRRELAEHSACRDILSVVASRRAGQSLSVVGAGLWGSRNQRCMVELDGRSRRACRRVTS